LSLGWPICFCYENDKQLASFNVGTQWSLGMPTLLLSFTSRTGCLVQSCPTERHSDFSPRLSSFCHIWQWDGNTNDFNNTK
jgi:hypothetical protein